MPIIARWPTMNFAPISAAHRPMRCCQECAPQEKWDQQSLRRRDDEAAAAVGFARQNELGAEFIVSVYTDRAGEKVMLFPLKGQNGDAS